MKTPVYTCDLCGYSVRADDVHGSRFIHGLAVDGNHVLKYVKETEKGEKHICSSCFRIIKVEAFEG